MALSLISFSAGTKIKSAEVNSNFNAINTELFDIDEDNFNVGAQLPDSLLAQIASTDKVDGAALVSETVDSVLGAYVWFLEGTLATGTNLSTEFVARANLTIVGTSMRCKTAPTMAAASGDAIIVDINKNGTTIYSTRPAIEHNQTTDDGADVLNVTTLAAGDVVTIDIDQVGDTVAGADLTVLLELKQKVPQ